MKVTILRTYVTIPKYTTQSENPSQIPKIQKNHEVCKYALLMECTDYNTVCHSKYNHCVL
jgi:hypothetical protein